MFRLITSNDASVDYLTPTLFHESWWLDIAAQGRMEAVEVLEKGKVIGRLPYYVQKNKLGMSSIDLPPLTHFLGPAIFECAGKPNTQFSRRLDITKELIRKLPMTAAAYIKCHRDITEMVGFQEAGFRTGVQFTHEILPQPVEKVWQNLRDKTRNMVRTARERYVITTGDDPQQFMRFYVQSIEQNKGVANHMDIVLHSKLIAACLERGRGQIYEAREPNGNLAAAIFCAWDNVSCYYLLTSRRPDAHGSGPSLLVWEAITDALKQNLIFDFDGFTSEGAERAATNFTHTLSPRYTAIRENGKTRMLRAAKSLIRQPSCFY